MNTSLSQGLLRDELAKRALAHFEFHPTTDQENAIYSLANFVTQISESEIFIFRGYAGTGKTTVIAALISAMKEMRVDFALLAPTGKAAKVLQDYSSQPTSTIHHRIFEIDRVVENNPEFRLSSNPDSGTIYFVDESSMISNESPGSDDIVFGSSGLLNELLTFVFECPNNRLIFIGDPAQLPPVKSTTSPALDVDYISLTYGFSVQQATLSTIVRQMTESGIRTLSLQIRELIDTTKLASSIQIPRLGDTIITPAELLQTAYSESLETNGLEETTILAHQNKTVNFYNHTIRRKYLHLRRVLHPGESVAITSNNYGWYIEGKVDYLANGEVVKIGHIGPEHQLGKYRFVDVDITSRGFDGNPVSLFGKILLNPLYPPNPPFTNEDRADLFRTVLGRHHGKNRQKCEVLARQDPFYNSLVTRHSYAMTVHRAQGSGWKTVFLDLSNWSWLYLQDSQSALRWLYTAVTRAKQRLYLIGLPAGATTIPLGQPKK